MNESVNAKPEGEQGLETPGKAVPPTLGLCEASLANAVSSLDQLRAMYEVRYISLYLQIPQD